MGLESAALITEGPLPFFPPDLSQRILTPKGAWPAAPRPKTVSPSGKAWKFLTWWRATVGPREAAAPTRRDAAARLALIMAAKR